MKKKSSSANDEALLKRLHAAGCATPKPVQRERPHDLVIQVSQPELTVAYDRRAGTEYVFSVRITNHSYVRLEVQRYGAVMPWRGHLHWPGDPRVYSPERDVYRLESGRTFPCEKVLNHRLRQHGELKPGESMEGILLAYTMFDRISFDYMHATLTPARLFAVDQFGRKHRSDLEILVDRSATMRPMSLTPVGTGLYGDGGMRPVVFSKFVPEPLNLPRIADSVTGGEKKPAADLRRHTAEAVRLAVEKLRGGDD